ncbi:MAG: hypothetical protein HY541_04905 [Deltaproteobacteria bacterium]|nr:hypothetical protein [Deltaproteobacteria bacterium]
MGDMESEASYIRALGSLDQQCLTQPLPPDGIPSSFFRTIPTDPRPGEDPGQTQARLKQELLNEVTNYNPQAGLQQMADEAKWEEEVEKFTRLADKYSNAFCQGQRSLQETISEKLDELRARSNSVFDQQASARAQEMQRAGLGSVTTNSPDRLMRLVTVADPMEKFKGAVSRWQIAPGNGEDVLFEEDWSRKSLDMLPKEYYIFNFMASVAEYVGASYLFKEYMMPCVPGEEYAFYRYRDDHLGQAEKEPFEISCGETKYIKLGKGSLRVPARLIGEYETDVRP